MKKGPNQKMSSEGGRISNAPTQPKISNRRMYETKFINWEENYIGKTKMINAVKNWQGLTSDLSQ